MKHHVHALLAGNLPAGGDRTALVCGDQRVSYAELDRRVESFASWLHAAGVRPGERVVIHLRKGIEEVVATLATARVDAVFCNVNPQWTAAQLEYVLGHCEPAVLVCDARKAAQIEGLGAHSLRRVALVGVGEPGIGAEEPGLGSGEPGAAPPTEPYDDSIERPAAPSPQASGDDLAALLYTSGSTGRPKGVMLSHRNVVEGAEIVAGYLGNTRDDRVLGFLPMSFDYGMSQLTTMLLVGGTLVLQPVAMASEIVRAVQAEQVTGLALVPPAWIQLARLLEESGERLPSLRYLTNSGGKVPGPILDLLPGLFEGAEIFLMYGLTEGFRSSYLPPEFYDSKRGSMGRAIPGVELHVVHPETGPCAPGEPGELIHRGKLISQGYWRDPEATAARIRPCPALGIGDEPVLFSGDLVRKDADGFLWFESRGDELIKCSGHRLSPTEVEEAAHKSGLVTDAVAFGVADHDLGQVVHLAASGRAADGQLDLPALTRHFRTTLPNYMVPRRIHPWTGDMPRTGSGKIDRPSVIRDCRAQLEPPPTQP